MPIRITGFGSGLDIDRLVSDIMRAERIPLDKLNQKKTLNTWKADLYREINTKLASLRSALDNIKLSGDWRTYKTASTNASVVTATASGAANPISHTVEVLSLAKGAALNSSGQLSTPGLTANGPAADLTIDGENNQFNITLDGVTKTITLTAKTYSDHAELRDELQAQIDAAFGAGKLTVSLDAGDKLSFTPAGTVQDGEDYRPQVILQEIAGNGGLSNLGFADGASYKVNRNAKISESLGIASSGSFTINGQTIHYTADDTLAGLISKVNNSAAGVTMSYDEIADKIVVTTKQTGSVAKIQFGDEGDAGGLLDKLKLSTDAVYGEDNKVKIDGVLSYRSSNTFTLDGVTYTLNGTGAATVSVTQDVDAAVDKIKAFVEQYNETVELINKRLREEKFRDYQPLTDDQKSEMKDDEIKLWEEKAKSGLLRNDMILKNTLNDLRSLLSEAVAGVSPEVNALYKIGLETMAYDAGNTQNSGKIQINETALRQALENDMSGVIDLFTKVSTNGNEQGIAARMFNRVDSAIRELVEKAGASGAAYNLLSNDLGYAVNNLEKQISAFQAKLFRREEYYYKKFAAMESAMMKSNNQLSWLYMQFQ